MLNIVVCYQLNCSLHFIGLRLPYYYSNACIAVIMDSGNDELEKNVHQIFNVLKSENCGHFFRILESFSSYNRNQKRDMQKNTK